MPVANVAAGLEPVARLMRQADPHLRSSDGKAVHWETNSSRLLRAPVVQASTV
jgi:hypothetical protein